MAVFTATEALEMAMEIEKNGEAFYHAVAARHEGELKDLFEDLAVQERGHYQLFNSMLSEITAAPPISGVDSDEYRAYLQAALDNALFSGPDKALTAIGASPDRETALRTAIGFEKDTLLFFYDLREMVSEKDRDAVSNVIREEKRHVRRLAKLL